MSRARVNSISEHCSTVEREYSPSTRVDSLETLLDGYRRSSLKARTLLEPATHAYGDLSCETVDFFSADQPRSPVHIFLHGGYWQELGKEDASFPAPGFVRSGVTFVAVDYGLAPTFDLDEIVAQVRRAVAWVYANDELLDVDPAQIVLSGSSAGAHLAAMAALTDWPALGVPQLALKGLVLLSGIYDLKPLLDTYVNDALGLDLTSAHRNSPLRLLVDGAHTPTPTIVAWAENETDAFSLQSQRFAEAWNAAGNPVVQFEARDRNHFDVVYDLSDRDSPLGELIQVKGREWGWLRGGAGVGDRT
jgi:arylformamidase